MLRALPITALLVLLSSLGFAPAALASTPEAAPAAAEGLPFSQEKIQVVADESRTGYRLLVGGGDPISQLHFAELTQRPDDVAYITAVYDARRLRGWSLFGVGSALILTAISIPVWAPRAFGNDSIKIGIPMFLGFSAAGLGFGWFAYQDYKYLVENEDNVSPSDPHYTLEEARQIAEEYNRQLQQRSRAQRGQRGASLKLGWRF